MSERIVDAYEAAAEDMCPNCVTPWKCNGPHEPRGNDGLTDAERAHFLAEFQRGIGRKW